MLANFQYELIAVALLFIVLIVFFILKSKKKEQGKETPQNKESEIDSQKRADRLAMLEEHEEPHQETTIVEDAYDDPFEGSEEGDFGSETPKETPEEVVQKEEEPELETQTANKKIAKRTVPAHGKINKQNFTEFSGIKVLVAEDNLINQKVITGLLAGSGIELSMANDGQEALDILEKDSDFLMVLMDAHMPVMDGFEATRAIRANSNYDNILVVALSGDTAADDIRKMQEAGMAEQLEKPLRMDALYDIFYAYSGEEKSKKDDNIIEVINTKELDGEKGLSICGGDEDFYTEILNEFVQDYTNSSQRIEQLLHNGELKHVDRILLDIIGITANIGADPLHRIAQDFKVALSDTNEKSYLTIMEQYNVHLKQLLFDIKEYK